MKSCNRRPYLSDSRAIALEAFVYTTPAIELRLFALIVMGRNLTTARRCCHSHSLYPRLSYSDDFSTSVEGLSTPLLVGVRDESVLLSANIFLVHGGELEKLPPQRYHGHHIQVTSNLSSRLRILSSSLHNIRSPHSLVSFLVERYGIP